MSYCFDRTARQEIKSVFRDYNGALTPRQRELLGRYGVVHEQTSRGRTAFHYGGRRIVGGGNMHAHRASMNFALSLIRLLEEKGPERFLVAGGTRYSIPLSVR